MGDHFGRGGIGQLVELARLADVPVLAEPASEIAAGGAEGQHAGAGMEMVERFLLDGINAEAAAAAISRKRHLVADAPADETEPALALVELAEARAQAALDAAVRQLRPPTPGVVGFGHRRVHGQPLVPVRLAEFFHGKPLDAHRLKLANASLVPRGFKLLLDGFNAFNIRKQNSAATVLGGEHDAITPRIQIGR